MKKFSIGRGLTAVAGLFLMAASNPAAAAPLTAAMASAGCRGRERQVAWRNDGGDRRGCDRERQRPPGASCLVGHDEPDAVDRSRSRLALPEWLAALRTGRSLQQWRGAECGRDLPRDRRLLRSARRNARGSARGCSRSDESGRFGPLSVELVRDGQAAGAILLRPQGPLSSVDANCDAWRKAQAIARLAVSNAVPSLSNDVLWYHANYVAPSWGRRLTRATQIGTHIFYRA